jgi:hypothetical protein
LCLSDFLAFFLATKTPNHLGIAKILTSTLIYIRVLKINTYSLLGFIVQA